MSFYDCKTKYKAYDAQQGVSRDAYLDLAYSYEITLILLLMIYYAHLPTRGNCGQNLGSVTIVNHTVLTACLAVFVFIVNFLLHTLTLDVVFDRMVRL